MKYQNSPELHIIWNEAKEHIERGNYDKAIEIYKYILIRYSDEQTAVEYANAYLGDIYLTLRHLDLAESHIKKAIKLKPENPGYHYILGFIYSIQRQWDKAIGEFDLAIAKEPNNAEYMRGLGWAIHSAGDKAKGLSYLLRANHIAPTNVRVLADLAIAYLSELQFNKAKKYATKAVHLDPGSSIAKDVLDSVNRFQKRHKRPSE